MFPWCTKITPGFVANKTAGNVSRCPQSYPVVWLNLWLFIWQPCWLVKTPTPHLRQLINISCECDTVMWFAETLTANLIPCRLAGGDDLMAWWLKAGCRMSNDIQRFGWVVKATAYDSNHFVYPSPESVTSCALVILEKTTTIRENGLHRIAEPYFVMLNGVLRSLHSCIHVFCLLCLYIFAFIPLFWQLRSKGRERDRYDIRQSSLAVIELATLQLCRRLGNHSASKALNAYYTL